jgi:hypothetical protein
MGKSTIKYWLDKSVDYAIGFSAGGGTLKMGTEFLAINPFYVWLGSLVIAMGVWHWSTIVRKTKSRKPVPPEEVIGKNFINESVVLNKKFVNCRFDACTLQYTGEDFEFYQGSVLIGETCRFEFKTKDSAIAAHLIYDFYTALQDKNTQFMLWDSYSIPRKKPEVVLKSK